MLFTIKRNYFEALRLFMGEEGRPLNIQCIHLNGAEAVATDGTRLIRIPDAVKGNDRVINIPSYAVTEILKVSKLFKKVEDIIFKDSGKNTYEAWDYHFAPADVTFPDYAKVMPKAKSLGGRFDGTVQPFMLVEALEAFNLIYGFKGKEKVKAIAYKANGDDFSPACCYHSKVEIVLMPIKVDVEMGAKNV